MSYLQLIVDQFTATGGQELEIRVGYFTRSGFCSEISPFSYFSMINLLSQREDLTMSSTRATIYMYGRGVRTVITRDEEVTIQKQRKLKQDFDNGLRVALSDEVVVPRPNRDSKEKERTRVSFTSVDGMYRIDLTDDDMGRYPSDDERYNIPCMERYHAGARRGNSYHIYQLEVEILQPMTLEQLNGMITYLSELVTVFEYDNYVVYQFNSFFERETRRRPEIPYVGKMPVSLKRENIPFLINHPVLLKFDGIPYYLFFDQGMAHYINRTSVVRYGPSPPELDGTIIFGEFMAKYGKFYAFETFYIQGYNTQHEPFTKRYSYLFQINEALQRANLVPFDISPIFTSENMHDNVVEALKMYNPDDFDGILFTNEFEQKTLKWKPANKITIDFLVQRESGDTYKLFSGDKNNTLTEFAGGVQITSQQVQKLTGLSNVNFLSDGAIVEFRYSKSRGFIPERIRLDKVIPNFITTAKSTWEDMENPITLRDLIRLTRCTFSPNDTPLDHIRKICAFIKYTGMVDILDQIDNPYVLDAFRFSVDYASRTGQRGYNEEITRRLKEFFSSE